MEITRVNEIAELANRAIIARKDLLELDLTNPKNDSKANELLDAYIDSCKEIWLIVKSWEEN